jgi:hypothetical protein
MGGRAGETFVEMQFHLPMPTRSKQGVGPAVDGAGLASAKRPFAEVPLVVD